MSETIKTESELFYGGPPLQFQRALGLIKPDEPRIVLRALLAVLGGWVPLVILVATQDLAPWGEGVKAVLCDFAAYAYFLIAAPLLIVAEPLCIARLGAIGRYFLDSGLVPESDRTRFDAAVTSTRRLRDSVLVEIALVILTYMVANRVVHEGVPLAAYTYIILALVVCVIILFSGPLLVFTGKLFQEKVRGTLEYGALATGEGLQFERKWLKRLGTIDESALEASDFSATTDLYQVVANVYDMGVIPLDLRNLLLLIIATLLPFVPVLLMALPFDVILQELAGLLL
jgi:hypothetical protein